MSLTAFGLVALTLVLASLGPARATRQFTIDNQCPSGIYVSIGSPSGGAIKADGSAQEGSWMQEPGTYTFTVPDGWKDGRIWAQTGCDGAGADPANPSCVIGNCGGGPCDGSQYGTPGATLAEFTLNGHANSDSYDISMVDGYNLPMQIQVQGCNTASCGVDTDIIEVCDPSLVYPKGSDKIYSCASACNAGVQFQDGTGGQLISAEMASTPVCCQHNGAGVDAVDCPNTYIPFYKKMKELCLDGYIYPKDDMYPGAILNCPADSSPAYTVTFCPGGKGAALNAPPASSARPMDSTPGDNAGNHEGGGASSPIWGGKLQGGPVQGGGGSSAPVPSAPAGPGTTSSGFHASDEPPGGSSFASSVQPVSTTAGAATNYTQPGSAVPYTSAPPASNSPSVAPAGSAVSQDTAASASTGTAIPSSLPLYTASPSAYSASSAPPIAPTQLNSPPIAPTQLNSPPTHTTTVIPGPSGWGNWKTGGRGPVALAAYQTEPSSEEEGWKVVQVPAKSGSPWARRGRRRA